MIVLNMKELTSAYVQLILSITSSILMMLIPWNFLACFRFLCSVFHCPGACSHSKIWLLFPPEMISKHHWIIMGDLSTSYNQSVVQCGSPQFGSSRWQHPTVDPGRGTLGQQLCTVQLSTLVVTPSHQIHLWKYKKNKNIKCWCMITSLLPLLKKYPQACSFLGWFNSANRLFDPPTV